MKDKFGLIASIMTPIALIIIIIFLFMNTNDSVEKGVNNNDNIKIDTNINYPEWMEYIINSDINSVQLIKSGEDEIKTSLTKEELKEIFSGLLSENDEVVKLYSDSYGYTGGYDLVVDFSINENNYKFEIMNGMILCYSEVSGRKDNQDFINLIENSNVEVVNETDSDIVDNMDFVYKFRSTKTFDRYIKIK